MAKRIVSWLLAAFSACALAQPYPSKPIRLIVPFPPSGGTDLLSRAVSHAITQEEKWSFVVENKPGAGGSIGLELAAKSAPDGYTIAMGQTSNLAVNPALLPKLGYDALKDFAPIALVSTQPLIVVVSAAAPYKTLEDLVAAAKAKPGALNMASAGNGTIGHVGGELFQRRAGIKLTHVPYKGAAPAVTDLLGGSVETFFGNSQSVGALVTGGRLRALAVTSSKRMATFPDVPTVAERGYPGFEAATWSGLVAPAGTPDPVVERLNAAVLKALRGKDLQQRLAEEGSTPLGGTSAQFAAFLKAEHAKWGAVVRESGIKPD